MGFGLGMGGGGGAAGPSFDSGGYMGDNFSIDGGNVPSSPDMGPLLSGGSPGSGAAGGLLGGGEMGFGAGLVLSGISGLFSALGGWLQANELGAQARRLKQTPANSSSSVAAAAAGRRSFAPQTPFAPGQQAPAAAPSYAALPPAPMLSRPDAGRQAMAQNLQSKMQGLLTQVGSPQLKASRFGVGGF